MQFRSLLPLPALLLVSLLLVSSLAHSATAQQPQPQAIGSTTVERVPPKVERPSTADVPLLDAPVHLSDFNGMAPRAGLREHMHPVSAFVQTSPTDGSQPTEKTEVWMGRTRTTLYFVFLCHDSHIASLRAHLARRENILSDDNVSVLLDAFQDRRHAIKLQVNALGVQADASYSETDGNDYSFDLIWDSEGRITKDGWMALIAVPFRSLRFRQDSADWGVVFRRQLPRNSENDTWPRIAQDISGQLTQEGTLRGISDVIGSHNIQLNPYILGQSERTLSQLDPLHPFFSNRKAEFTGGGDAKLILKDKIVLDATINPDFSQVESDQPQLTVNQRFSVYFPELRPFFLENANYFSTPLSLVYTRNIVHPEFGLRATGKLGHTNIGAFTIDDRFPGEAIPHTDPNYGKHAIFAVGRVSQDIGKASSIGAVYTDQQFAGANNRIGGLDFLAHIDDHWSANGEMVESSTRYPDGSYAAGPASYLEFNRSGHAFNFDQNYKDASTGFQTQVGFIQTSNIRTDAQHATYQWYPRHAGVLQSYGIETNNQVAWDHQGNRLYHYTSGDPFFLLKRNTTIAPIVGENSDTLGPQSGTLFTHNHNFTENLFGIVARSAPFAQLSFNVQAFQGGNVNYNPLPGAVPFLLHQQTVTAYVTVNPIQQFTIDNTYLLDRNHATAGGAFVYENQVLRTKMNFQFTRALSARVIVEYDSLLANPTQTSLQRTKQVQTQALLTWLPHPGTAIYVGYNSDLQNLGRTLCNRTLNGQCDPTNTSTPRSTNYLNDGRQLFIKASYLYRF